MKGIKQVKNYRLVKEIIKGNPWTVYEAIDDSTNIMYAVKTLQRSKENKSTTDSIKKELKHLRTLYHENLVKIKGYEKTFHNIYLALEYCNGGSLLNYLKYYIGKYKTPLPENKVQFIMRQIINGLYFMSKNNLLHRDLKLENILINYNYTNKVGNNLNEIYEKFSFFDTCLKISDLGYLNNEGKYLEKSTVCGLPFNSLIDDIKDNSFNYKVFLFSLGSICYELLTGMYPISNCDESNNNVKEEDCINRLEISIEAISFINELFQKDPKIDNEWSKIINHAFIINDTSSFKKILLEKISVDAKEKRRYNNKIWDMYRSHMISCRIEHIELISICEYEKKEKKLKKENNEIEDDIISIKTNLIFKENSKSRNNSNSSIDFTQKEDKVMTERIKSYDLLSINKFCDEELNKKNKEDEIQIINYYQSTENDQTNIKSNTDLKNLSNNSFINEYNECNSNGEEKWEILYSDSKWVDVLSNENHFILMQDYFN